MIHNDGLGDYSIKMLINNREEVRDRYKRQLLSGRRDVRAGDNPELYQNVSDLEAKIHISEKSLKNLTDAADIVELYGKAIPHLIEIIQKMISISLDTKQAGLADGIFNNNLRRIRNLETELNSAILLYKFKRVHIFDYKKISQSAAGVEKRFNWDISNNLLNRERLVLQKPSAVIGETLLYKASLVDSNTYSTTGYNTNTKTTRGYVSYNILVLEADIIRLRAELDTINSFNSSVAAKRRLLLTTLDNNYRMLKEAVGVDSADLQTKIHEIEKELQIARSTWKASALNDPITNTVASLLEI